MKKITLFGPTIVNDEIRHPHENPIEVSDVEAQRLRSAGALLDDPTDVAGKTPARSKTTKRKKAAATTSAPATPTVEVAMEDATSGNGADNG